MSTARRRGGFTLVEVLIVAVLIGVLTGIATPSFGRVIHRAAAARVVSDVRNLSVAVRSFLEAGGTLPHSSPWAVAPTELAPYLEESMPFSFRDVEYRFVTQPNIEVAQLWVRYPVGSPLGEALERYRRPGDITWTPTRTTFVLAR